MDEDEYVVTLRDAIEPLLTSVTPLTFFGHTHLQGSFCTNNVASDYFRPQYNTVGQSETSEFPLKENMRYMVNPGSVGQPRDGDWRAAFALFDSDARIVTFCRVPYNLKQAQDRIIAANLPQRLATRWQQEDNRVGVHSCPPLLNLLLVRRRSISTRQSLKAAMSAPPPPSRCKLPMPHIHLAVYFLHHPPKRPSTT